MYIYVYRGNPKQNETPGKNEALFKWNDAKRQKPEHMAYLRFSVEKFVLL